MFNFDKSEIQRFAVSSVGAITLTAASLFAAAGPVKAATPLTADAWEAQVAQKVEAVREPARTGSPAKLSHAQVAVNFTADGDYAGATLAKSSGLKSVDDRALKLAARVAYPTLPAGYRGQAQTVTMNLYFGDVDTAGDYAAVQARQGRAVQIARADTGVQVASR